MLSGLILLHRFRRAGVFGSCTVEGQLREHCGTCEKREDNSDSDSFVNRVKKIVTRVGPVSYTHLTLPTRFAV